MLIAMFLLACTEDPVSLQGTVLAAREASEPLEGARVTVIDTSSGQAVGETSTADDGTFQLPVPAGLGVALVIEGDGLVPAVFHGNIATRGVSTIERGALFGVSRAEVEAVRARFAGCPGADGGAAFLYGQTRIFGLVDEESGRSPIAAEAQVDLVDVSDEGEIVSRTHACYLDDEGERYDPYAEFAGFAGEWALFDVEPGFRDLEARNQVAPNDFTRAYYPAWVPETEAVLPLWPTWVILL